MSPAAVLNTIDAKNTPTLTQNGIEDVKSASVVVNDIDIAKTPLEVPIGIDVATCPSGLSSDTNATDTHANFSYPEAVTHDPYRVVPQYHSKPSKLRVAGIGAGASGMYDLNFAIFR